MLKVAPYAEVGLINHNTTMEERERERGPECPIHARPHMNNIQARGRIEAAGRLIGGGSPSCCFYAYSLFVPLFFLLPHLSKGGESLKET